MNTIDQRVEDTLLHDLDEAVKYEKLPPQFYPECWKDDVRMNVLFAPFRERAVNALNYDNKLRMWIQLIQKYCEHKGSAAVSLAELRMAFMRANKKPHCLDKVLDELRATGQLLPVDVFLEPPQHTWKGWAIRHMTKAMSLPVLAIKARIWQQSDSTQQPVVLLDAVKKQADKLQQNCLVVDKLMMVTELKDKMKECGLCEEGVELALHSLWRERRASIVPHTTISGQKVDLLKISAPNGTDCSISKEECQMYDLIDTLEKQQKIVRDQETEIVAADKTIRAYMKSGQKSLAKMHLKRKHVLEKKLDKNMAQLHNLSTLVETIPDAKQNADMVEIIKMSSERLKKIYEDSGLTVDSVDDVLADAKEVMDDHNEILNMVSTPHLDSSLIDESLLEKELLEMTEGIDKKAEIERNLDESIEHRLKELNLTGILDLSPSTQQRILAHNSAGQLEIG